MTKQVILDMFSDIDFAYNNSSAHDTLSMMLDELLDEQHPKTGHWLKKMSNYPSAVAMGGSRTSACDLCGGWGRKAFKYCPHCGAKMEEPD